MDDRIESSGFRELVIASLVLGLVLALPLLSYPLAVLPQTWAPFRFQFHFPWIALGTVVLLFALVSRRGGPLRLTHHAEWLIGVMLAFFLLQTISALWSGGGRISFAWLVQATGHMMLCLAVSQFLTSRWLKRIALAWVLTAAIEAAIMVLQKSVPYEPVGTIGNRNFAAGYLVLSLPVGVACVLAAARRQAAGSQAQSLYWTLGGVYVALMLGALVVSESRAAAGSLLVVLTCWGLARLPRPKRWLAVGGVVIVLGGLCAFSPARDAARKFWQTDVRPMIWLGAARCVVDAPWLGHGPGSFAAVYPAYRPPEYFDRAKPAQVSDHAHNELIEVAVETGFVGLSVFIALLWVAARTARRACRIAGDDSLRVIAVGMTLGLAALALQNLVDINLRMPPNESLCWLALGWLAASQRAGDAAGAGEKLLPVRRFTRLLAWASAAFVIVLGVAQPVYADWFFRQGLIAQRAGNNERALICFARVTRASAGHFEAWRQLGLTAVQLGRLDLGVGALRAAHLIMPDYGDLSGELGSVLAMARRFAEAGPLLVRATQLYPRDAKNFAKLALVRSGLREFDAARAALEQAKRLRPTGELEDLVRYAEQEIQRAQSR